MSMHGSKKKHRHHTSQHRKIAQAKKQFAMDRRIVIKLLKAMKKYRREMNALKVERKRLQRMLVQAVRQRKARAPGG